MREKSIVFYDKLIEWCLYLLIFCLPFTKAGIEFFASIAIAMWIVKKFIMHKMEEYFPSTELNSAMGAFVIVNLLSVITSANLYLSIKGLFGKLFEYILLYFIVVEAVKNKKQLKNIMIAIVFSAILMVIDTGVQTFTGTDFLRRYPKEGPFLTASFQSHNDFGGWLIVLIPLFLCLPFLKELKKSYQRLILGVLGLLLLICLLLTYSRGAWIGSFVGFGFILIYSIADMQSYQHKITISLFLIICLMGVFFILPSTIKERFTSISNFQEGSGFKRVNAWKEALNITGDYPLFGSGLNTYSFIGPRYKMFEGGGIYPHNSFLQMSAETGIVGLVCFLWIVLELFKSGIRALKRYKDPLLLGLLAGLLAFLTHSFFDTNLYALQMVVLFWYMMGLAVAVMRLELDVSK